jgi:hypothetical protein
MVVVVHLCLDFILSAFPSAHTESLNKVMFYTIYERVCSYRRCRITERVDVSGGVRDL